MCPKSSSGWPLDTCVDIGIYFKLRIDTLTPREHLPTSLGLISLVWSGTLAVKSLSTPSYVRSLFLPPRPFWLISTRFDSKP